MSRANDAYITVSEVKGDNIVICVHPGFIGCCTRKAAETLATFDFVNRNGVLSHIHVGHGVKRLKLGRLRRGSV